MPLGNPIRKQNESRIVSVLATEGQTVFTVQGGYIINHISVFRNGVRLSNSEDFTAGDGSTVTLNNAANIEDRIEFHVFDRFTVQNAIVSAASTQTINGDVVVNGKIFGNLDVPSINTGIVTATELDLNGKGDISSDLNVVGVTTVGKQVHVGTGVSIAAGGLNVTAGITTVGKAIIGTGVTIDQSNIDTVGIITASTFNGALTGNVTGTITGAATQITVAGETSDTTCFPVFVTTSTGNQEPKTRGTLTFNSSTGALGAPSFVGGTISGTTGTFTGDVSIPDTIVHTGDTNTKIRFPANDVVSIETAGSERLRVTANGRLGLGEGTNVTQKLHIREDSNSQHYIAYLQNRYSGSGTSSLIAMSCGTVDFADDRYAYMGAVISGTSENGNNLVFATNASAASPTEKLRIDGNGRLTLSNSEGIKLSAKTSSLYTLDGSISYYATDNAVYINGAGASGWLRLSAAGTANNRTAINLYGHSYSTADAIDFRTNSTSRMHIDSSGRVKINTTATPTGYGALNIFGTDNAGSRLAIRRGSADANGPQIWFNKSRNTTDGSHTVVQAGDLLGSIVFTGNDSQGPEFSARIMCEVDGTPGSNDMPGRLVFSTTPDGSDTLAERMRITSAGQVRIETATQGLRIGIDAANYTFTRDASGGDAGLLKFYGNQSNYTGYIFSGVDGERMRIDSSGNVSINGTPPWSVSGGDYRNLSISGQTASSSGFLWLGNGAETTNADFDLGRINFNNGPRTVARVIGSTQTSANDDGRLVFYTKQTGQSEAERFRITHEGVTIRNAGAGGGIGIVANGTTSEYGLITANANRSGDGDLLLGVGASWNGDSVSQIDFRTGDDTSNKDNGQIMFYTQETSGGGLVERMRINEAGNIGMGEDEPNRAALHVRGADSSTSIVAKFRNPAAGANTISKLGLVTGYGDHNQDTEGHAYIAALRAGSGNQTSMYFETFHDGGNQEQFRVTHRDGEYLWNGDVRQFYKGGYANVSASFSYDITCANDASQGQVFILEAFHTHYNHSYSCGIITVLYYRGTNLLNQTNLFSQTSSLGGNWGFSKPGNSSFRIQKNGGTYNYPGYWWIRVTCNGKSY